MQEGEKEKREIGRSKAPLCHFDVVELIKCWIHIGQKKTMQYLLYETKVNFLPNSQTSTSENNSTCVPLLY